MKDWKPKPAPGVDPTRLPLDAEGGFLLSRLDGATAVGTLPLLTGLPPARIEALLTLLVEQGALLPPPGASSAGSSPPPPPAGTPVQRQPRQQRPEPRQAEPEVAAEPAADAEEAPEEAEPAASGEESREEPPDGEPDGADPAVSGDYRKIYEQRFHPLPPDERIAAAASASGDLLLALCLDPVPLVINAIFDNAKAGLTHARLVALHHRNPAGLAHVVRRAAFARDTQVQRLLLRNPQLTEGMFKTICASKRLLQLQKLTVDRDVPERTRRSASVSLRARFATAQSEEKVELIVTTEGRVLPALSGLGLDGRSVALLCARTITSHLLITNLGRWPSTPPQLLLHLSRQPPCRAKPSLRQLLERHPNAPRELRER